MYKQTQTSTRYRRFCEPAMHLRQRELLIADPRSAKIHKKRCQRGGTFLATEMQRQLPRPLKGEVPILAIFACEQSGAETQVTTMPRERCCWLHRKTATRRNRGRTRAKLTLTMSLAYGWLRLEF